MGANITCMAEVKKNGEWAGVTEELFSAPFGDAKKYMPFGKRVYDVFSFLRGVRGDGSVECILPEPQKVIPDDISDETFYELNRCVFEESCTSMYWFDSEPEPEPSRSEEIQDVWRRCTNHHSAGYLTLEQLNGFDLSKFCRKEDGVELSYREVLGEGFISDLNVLNTLGQGADVRIVFWFEG